MIRESGPPSRRVWLVIIAAMMFAVIQYGVLLQFFLNPGTGGGNPDAASLRTLFIRLASGAILLSALWSWFRVPPRGDASAPLPPPAVFQRESIISMALAEACAVLGFTLCLVTSRSLHDYLIFGGGAMLMLAGVCLPKGLSYWASLDVAGRTAAGSGRPQPIE